MKISLIRPPFAVEEFYFPRFVSESLALESLDAFLSPSHQVQAIDAVAHGWNKYSWLDNYPGLLFQGLKPVEILKMVSDFKPEIIGLNWLFSTQSDSIELLTNEIRKSYKDIQIIVGGPHPSASPKQILMDNKNIDIVVYGEGEITLKEILDQGGKNLPAINGIAFRQGEEIITNPPRKLIENLDILPIPKRQKNLHLTFSKQKFYQAIYSKLKKLNLEKRTRINLTAQLSSLPFHQTFFKLHNLKNAEKLPLADIVTSRGCPNHCNFCAVHNIWGHGCRMRSADNILAEIEMLVSKFGVKHLNIQDDNFNVSKQRTIDICKGIVKNNYKISLLAPAGAFVPTLDEEVLTWLKKAGLNSLRMSIESGNQDILHNVIKKNINLDQVKEVVDICKKLKIFTEGAFIFGIPGETIETMQDSLNFAQATGFDRIIKFIFQPMPNTKLYNLCVEKGYLTENYDPKRAYITGNNCYVKTDKFSPEDVLRLINRR